MFVTFRAVLAPAAVAALTAACTIGEEIHETVTQPARVRSESRVCRSAPATPDLARAKPCGGGKGHCWDASRVPLTDLDEEGCGAGEACVPDAVLTARGAKLAACTFFMGGAPGACVSTLQKGVAAHADVLRQESCGEAERCVPCVDPTNGSDTHVCDPMGAYVEPCTGGEDEPPERLCCHGAGTCLRDEGVPEEQRSSLSRETCGAGKLCAPRAMVSGKPVACSWLGARGVCLDVCFAGMLRPVAKVARAGCGPTEVCLPCAIGEGEGMPGCE